MSTDKQTQVQSTVEALSVYDTLKLALNALEECRRDPRLKYEHPYYDKTITAIREALMSVPDGAEQPAQRTWIELTDEEMNAALDYWSEDERSAYGGAHAADGEYVSMIDTWRYIEAKLKEKNGF